MLGLEPMLVLCVSDSQFQVPGNSVQLQLQLCISVLTYCSTASEVSEQQCIIIFSIVSAIAIVGFRNHILLAKGVYMVKATLSLSL